MPCGGGAPGSGHSLRAWLGNKPRVSLATTLAPYLDGVRQGPAKVACGLEMAQPPQFQHHRIPPKQPNL
eukprot:7251724-Lingulodinium_polyedra.AAC.1